MGLQRLLPALLLCLIPALTGAADGLRITDAWARATPPTIENGAAYLVIRNSGRRDDVLVGARTPRAPGAELHRSTSGGMASMQHTPRVRVPAGGRVAFEPGGRHVMLTGLQTPLTAGERFPLTLVFERAGELEVMVPVQPATAMGPPETSAPD